MPNASFRVRTTINAAPEVIFASIADLSLHSQWAANQLLVEPISPGPVTLGHRYRSTAQVNGITFTAELQITTYQPPFVFAFAGEDQTGQFEHRFTIRPTAHGAQVERHVRFTLTLRQWLLFLVLLYPVRLPAAKKALLLLKQRIEQRDG
jgi:uncharacterized protein YndB with AHSA1/START domain